MPKDERVRAEFAATLTALAADEQHAAHEALRDPLAPLVADVERALRVLGQPTFRRRDAAAYRTSDAALRLPAPRDAQLDLKY